LIGPLAERVAALDDAIRESEDLLRSLGFEPDRLLGVKGWARISALADAVEAINAAGRQERPVPEDAGDAKDDDEPNTAMGTDQARHRFEILARVVFQRFKALVTEPSVDV
ncbi:MAG: hypothetical protein JNK57_22600, partial [Planctomycetaceae bacterium]|nr:hypothetical protein [Planctomycetaceae bacterium]